MTSGKRLFLDLLRQEGVSVIFGNPGTTELPLMDALAVDNSMRYVLALQEASVMGMADGYAQASGRLSVASLHAAPGLGNAIGALHNAAKAGAPVLVTAGQQDLSYNLTEPNLWGNLTRIAEPFVKWSYEIQKFSDLPRAVHRAAKLALTPPTGPVFLSLPADLLNEEGDVDLGHPTRVGAGMRGDPQAIAAAARVIAQAQSPVIVAGDAVAHADASDELVAFAELIGAPVHLEGLPNRASFPGQHGLFRGPVVRLADDIRAAMKQHDLIVSVGGDLFTLAMPGTVDPMPDGMRVVHIDNDPWQLGKNYPTEAAIVGNAKLILAELSAALVSAMSEAQRAAARARCDAEIRRGDDQLKKLIAQANEAAAKEPVLPLAFSHAIAEALPSDAILIDESVSSGQGLRRLLKSHDPQSYFGGKGGGIGWGMPAAVGAKLAVPNRPVLAVIGDGSAMYSIQALYTAAREGLQIVFVIANNASYRIIKQRTHGLMGHAAQTGVYVGMDLTSPSIDHVAIARGFGLHAETVVNTAGLRAAIAAAFERRQPSLIDVAMDTSFKPL
jgi:benzoylformate decarboxylase